MGRHRERDWALSAPKACGQGHEVSFSARDLGMGLTAWSRPDMFSVSHESLFSPQPAPAPQDQGPITSCFLGRPSTSGLNERPEYQWEVGRRWLGWSTNINRASQICLVVGLSLTFLKDGHSDYARIPSMPRKLLLPKAAHSSEGCKVGSSAAPPVHKSSSSETNLVCFLHNQG